MSFCDPAIFGQQMSKISEEGIGAKVGTEADTSCSSYLAAGGNTEPQEM